MHYVTQDSAASAFFRADSRLFGAFSDPERVVEVA
jgi:hypothetical protein